MPGDEYKKIAEDDALAAAVTRVLAETREAQPSGDFLARVRLRVDEERRREPIRWTVGVPAWVTVAAIAAAVAVLVVSVRGRTPPETAGASSERDVRPPVVAVGVAEPTVAAPRRPSPPPRARRPRQERPAEPAQAPVRMADTVRAAATHGYTVVSLDADAPLPRLELQDLPQFELRRLEVQESEWTRANSNVEDEVSPGDERNES